MAKFVSVFGIAVLVLLLATLLWPRFSDTPRPQPLARLNSIIRGTPAGQNVAAVLGVSTEDTVQKITLQSIVGSIVTTAENRAIDIAVAQIVREISNRFRNLPQEHQQRILEAIGNSLNTSTATASPSR
jgi:hypothetical protein